MPPLPLLLDDAKEDKERRILFVVSLDCDRQVSGSLLILFHGRSIFCDFGGRLSSIAATLGLFFFR